MSDDKTSPGYYKKGGMECREAIKAATSNLQGEEAYNVGCAIKYLWRFKEKNGLEDLRKARQYIDFLIGDLVAVSMSKEAFESMSYDVRGDGGR